jgi:Protein of unknown function (DUF3306)
MSSEPFISRWSKRKQAARTAEQAEENALPPQPEPQASGSMSETAMPEPASGIPAPSEAELSAEEIARLPSLEELTADTDISMFLRKGVPEPLRNAALRRMWSLDPKIRDFVCEAREYAYDWNTPGGVPGSGPLPLTGDITRMVARIVGGGASAADASEADAGTTSAHSHDREQQSPPHSGAGETRAAVPPEATAVIDEAEASGRAADETNVLAPSSSPLSAENREPAAAAQMPGADVAATPASLRRHGGALPL